MFSSQRGFSKMLMFKTFIHISLYHYFKQLDQSLTTNCIYMGFLLHFYKLPYLRPIGEQKTEEEGSFAL